ncbi:hypothetical protein H5125_12800 [Shewanella sp. SR44-4]|uniref:hypothetical protein n=1 Tax=Shewanella sp. SR44-4 TaxID=2760935 RepID=UPI0016032BA0|nr:hypothetical protein [Shewanella sp. SR44-4]MBB1363023.1 hypothetical protein [Shewanella sp. SR44-4]
MKDKIKRKDLRTRVTIRLSFDNKLVLDNHKKLLGSDSYEELIMSLINKTSGRTKKVLVDPEGYCLKSINYLMKYSTNLNQLAKIANENKMISDEQFKEFQRYTNELIKVKSYLAKKVKIIYGKI